MAQTTITQSNIIRFPVERCRRPDTLLGIAEEAAGDAAKLRASLRSPVGAAPVTFADSEDPLLAIQLSARAQADRLRARLAAGSVLDGRPLD